MNIISNYLRYRSSAEHPIKGSDLANHFGITGIAVRKAVNEARSNGVPICATSHGYYYSDDREQIKKTVESLRGRIVAQENAITGLEALLT